MKAFVALNFLAGFLHYLFLVIASKKLPVESFSGLSAWLAYLSFAFIGAGVMQYLSCFVPLRRGQIKALIVAGLIYAVGIAILPFLLPFNYVIIGAGSGLMACAFGIFLGQAQVRILFFGWPPPVLYSDHLSRSTPSDGRLLLRAFKYVDVLIATRSFGENSEPLGRADAHGRFCDRAFTVRSGFLG